MHASPMGKEIITEGPESNLMDLIFVGFECTCVVSSYKAACELPPNPPPLQQKPGVPQKQSIRKNCPYR